MLIQTAKHQSFILF